MSLIEYRNLLYEVSKNIAWITERERLLFICKIFLPHGYENDIQDVLSLLIKLEEQDQLGIDSLDVLKDLLKRMGKWDLLHIVEKFENKRKEYKRFLEQCGRVLDECSQLERLISVCKGKISRDRQENITDVWTLFTELEKQNNLGIERLEILKAMAVEMEKPDMLEQVEEFEKKTKQEEDAERKQNELEEAKRRSQGQTAAVLASAGYAGGRLIGIVTPHCTFRNVAGGIVVVTTWMILRRSSSLQEFVNAFTETVLPLGNNLRAISEGSLCFTVQAQTTLALAALWKEYQDGTLQQKLQEFLITEEIKQLVGSEVMLTVKIDEQEYNNAGWDLIITETQEMELKEERKGFEDQSSSDFAHAWTNEAHPQAREEVSEDADINLPDKIAFVEEYLANLQETYSMITETTDSGLGSQSAPSELQLYKGTETTQELLQQIDEWMKEISEKLDILTKPGGVATRDEDILDNILQVKKEMENIRKTLDTLEKPEGKTKYGGSGLTKRFWRAVTRKKKANIFQRTTPDRSTVHLSEVNMGSLEAQVVRFLLPPPPPPPPPPRFILSRDPNSDDEGDNRSLEGEIKVVQQPISQSQREGSKVEFTCECRVQGNCEVSYQWLKDDTELQQQNNASLILDSVKMRDFGRYRCRITSRGGFREVISEPAFLDVSPSEGKRLKYLREVDLGTLDEIAIRLDEKIPGLGYYRQVAANYGVNEHDIRALDNSRQPGKDVLDFLLGSNPNLTVYSFCKKLKEDHLKRFDILRILEGHLSIEKESK